MFQLGGHEFPASREAFAQALSEGLRVFGPAQGVTDIAGENFPQLEKLRIDLTGARVTSALRPSPGAGMRQPGVTAADFAVTADPLRYEQSLICLRITGRDVRLDFDRDANGRPVLGLVGAREGEIELCVARQDLEAILLAVAREAASRHGVSVESVELTLCSRGPRSVDFSVTVQAAKLFMKTAVTAAGRLEVDDQLNAKISNATCEGSGMIGALACGFLRPHLAKYEGRSIPLVALPLGDVQLRDLSLEAGDSLRLHARFGSTA